MLTLAPLVLGRRPTAPPTARPPATALGVGLFRRLALPTARSTAAAAATLLFAPAIVGPRRAFATTVARTGTALAESTASPVHVWSTSAFAAVPPVVARRDFATARRSKKQDKDDDDDDETINLDEEDSKKQSFWRRWMPKINLAEPISVPVPLVVSAITGSVALLIAAWPYIVGGVFYVCVATSVLTGITGTLRLIRINRAKRRAAETGQVLVDDETADGAQADDWLTKQTTRAHNWIVEPLERAQTNQQRVLEHCMDSLVAHPQLKRFAGADGFQVMSMTSEEFLVDADNAGDRFKLAFRAAGNGEIAECVVDATVDTNDTIKFRIFRAKLTRTNEMFDLADMPVASPDVIDVTAKSVKKKK